MIMAKTRATLAALNNNKKKKKRRADQAKRSRSWFHLLTTSLRCHLNLISSLDTRFPHVVLVSIAVQA